MIDHYLRDRLDRNTYRGYNAVLILTVLWHLYCMFDHSGLVGWFSGVQARCLPGGMYFPILSFALALFVSILPLAGLFLLYARLKENDD